MEISSDIFSSIWWSKLFAIFVIDLVLAGDNAIVIAVAANNLPIGMQRRAIFWGTVGAVVMRILTTIGVVWLLKIPGLMLIGGVLLAWIACKLLQNKNINHEQNEIKKSRATMRSAIVAIIVADLFMSLDNVLGVAGIAHGSIDLVAIGLMLSIPFITIGSALILNLVRKWPIIITLGAVILVLTANSMIASEPLISNVFQENLALRIILATLLMFCVFLLGRKNIR